MLHHKKIPTLRQKFWIWGHEPGVHDHYQIPGKSRMTAAEGALYMGIPNLMMVRYDKYPIAPYDQLALSFRSLDKVVWSLVGAGGRTSPEEREEVFQLAKRHPVIKGVLLDDFWSGGPEGNGGIVLTLDELKALHAKSKAQSLDLWCVLYVSELFRQGTIAEYLNYIDKFTLWSWIPEHLNKFEDKIKLYEDLIPEKPRYMGIYMWDYGRCQPMPLHIVQMQCEKGLELIQQQKLDGLIFLATSICDVGIDAVEWVRNWISRVGDQPSV
jgi:hypothetical protein